MRDPTAENYWRALADYRVAGERTPLAKGRGPFEPPEPPLTRAEHKALDDLATTSDAYGAARLDWIANGRPPLTSVRGGR